MDFFGIGSALRAALQIYFTASRATGRTTALLRAVRPGDLIIFASESEAKRVRGLLKQQGIHDVVCGVASPQKYDLDPAWLHVVQKVLSFLIILGWKFILLNAWKIALNLLILFALSFRLNLLPFLIFARIRNANGLKYD